MLPSPLPALPRHPPTSPLSGQRRQARSNNSKRERGEGSSILGVQQVEYVVRTHHVEYGEGGILDMDDLLSELLEDKDRVRDAPIGRPVTS
ncbi:unnamed protein product [Merluccius merluccius]